MDDLELRARLAIAEAKVSELTVRLKAARQSANCWRLRARRKRVPAVLEVEPTGDVTLYGDGLDVAIVEWPLGAWNATVEEWLGWQLNERHREIYLPSCVESRVNGTKIKRTLVEAYAAYERTLAELPIVKALVEASKKQRQHFERKQHAPKKTTNARTAAGKRRARGVE